MTFRGLCPKGHHQVTVYFGLSLYVHITSILAMPLLRAFEQGGIFEYRATTAVIWTSVFPVSSKGPPHSVASYDTQGDVESLF
jgi:hypothetical protein